MNNPSDKPEDIAVTVMIGNEPEEVTLSVNYIFNSLDELDKKIAQYRGIKAVQLWKRDLRTIKTARKQIDRHLDKRIKYYEVTQLDLFSESFCDKR